MNKPLIVSSEPLSGNVPDLAELTIEKVQAGFESGAFTAQTLAETSLSRVDKYNKKYNAIIFLNSLSSRRC